MDLKEVASVSGKPGLFRVVKPTRTGIILETIDDQKKKLVANANSRVSLLKEISIYTTSDSGSINLAEVFHTIKKIKGDQVDLLSDSNDLYSFLGEVVEDYDQERVYPNDIKKLISWYNTLSKHYPELLVPKEKPAADKKAKAEVKKEGATKKSTAKKKAEPKKKKEEKEA